MKFRWRPAWIAVMAVAMLVAGTGAADARNQPVPFIAHLTGQSTLTSQTSGDLSGAGYAIPMGRITNQGHVQAYPDQPRGTCPHGFRSVNTETFTAGNGATLKIMSEDAACPENPGQFRGTGHWTVVPGGTGRFADASGEGSFSGFVDFSAGTEDLWFAGIISLGVPFRATFSGSAASGPSSSTFVGSGNASYLGRILTNGVANNFQPDGSCPGGVANTNTETLTAANGDTLTIVSQDVACPYGPGLYRGTGQWSVPANGGTGRFAGVSGSGTYSGSADFVAGTFTIELTGTISY